MFNAPIRVEPSFNKEKSGSILHLTGMEKVFCAAVGKTQ